MFLTKASQTVKGAFNDYINDLDTFFMIISSEYGIKLYNRESLIIFDEIQKYPEAREAIKYFAADGRYDYIETGSLISIKENIENITIPSEERTISMYPLDFEEFAWVMEEEPLIEYIKKCFEERKPLEKGLHNKAMLLFRQYMIVGGMPQSINAYIENNRDFENFNCLDPNIGLSLNEDRTYVKCYMGDTGLLISHTFDENEISDNE